MIKKKIKKENILREDNVSSDNYDSKIYKAIKDVEENNLIDIPNGDLSILLED